MDDTMQFTLFHPSGVRVAFSIAEPPDTLGRISAYLAEGWLANAPGLEAGEEREDVGYVLRGEQNGETPFVLLYSTNDAMKHSFLKVYLNRLEDVEAFEYASKMKLNAMPLYEADNKPERGKNPKTDRYIVAPPKTFQVVFKANPKYDAAAAAAAKDRNEIYKTPKRVFVRWADQKPKQEHAEAPADELPEEPRTVDSGNAAQTAVALALEKAAENGEEALKAAWRVADKEAREACRSMWGLLVQRAKEVDANRGF